MQQSSAAHDSAANRNFIPQKTKPTQSPMQTPADARTNKNSTGRSPNVPRAGQHFQNFTSP